MAVVVTSVGARAAVAPMIAAGVAGTLAAAPVVAAAAAARSSNGDALSISTSWLAPLLTKPSNHRRLRMPFRKQASWPKSISASMFSSKIAGQMPGTRRTYALPPHNPLTKCVSYR